MNSITLKAYAKINLGLDVLSKRTDGYHDVCMIMQSIDLYDTLTIKKSAERTILVETNLSYLPNNQKNLVYRAAELFLEAFPQNMGVKMDLKKRIPVAAGLAGGSSDAAAALCGLNELFETGLSDEELMKFGVILGADVPYCIMLGTALSEGIGELLTPIKQMPYCDILLVKPNISVSTKYVYDNLKLDSTIPHPDILSMRRAIEEGNLAGLTNSMDNILQTVTIKDYPIITKIKEKMILHGAMTSLMSGSGPTVFGIFSDHRLAEKAFHYFKNSNFGKQVFLTRPYWPN